ncbi:MAG TPA: glycosyltransferase family A protein [Actinomycetota bacterium]|nr:glycosyltransferase family A protein [Actinomycetota bacterium]
MTTPADISVVIPAYNAGRYLGEAIESVRTQVLQPLEIIVVDDGSDDDTSEVVKRYPEVIYVRKENGGPASARNAGLRIAKGSVIAFHDSDDLMKPTRLADQFEYLVEHPEVDAVLGRQEIDLLDGVELPSWVRPSPLLEGATGVQLDGSIMARVDSLNRVGGFNSELTYSEGMDVLARLRDHGMNFAVLDKVIITRRVHDENMSYDTGPMIKSFPGVLHAHLKRTRGDR